MGHLRRPAGSTRAGPRHLVSHFEAQLNGPATSWGRMTRACMLDAHACSPSTPMSGAGCTLEAIDSALVAIDSACVAIDSALVKTRPSHCVSTRPYPQPTAVAWGPPGAANTKK